MEEVIKVSIDDSGAVADLDALRGKLDDVKTKAVEAGEQGVGSLKKQLRTLTEEMNQLDPASEKFAQLQKQASALKDRMKDTSEAINANAGPAIESFGNNVSLLKDRFASLDFEGVSQSFKAIAGNIKSVKPDDLIDGIKGMGSAFMSVGKALLTNPIFLIGAAIAAAVVYADELLSLVDGVSSAEAERQEQLNKNVKAQEDALSAISDQEESLKLQGKSEREILQMKIAQSQEAINAAVTALENQKMLKQQQVEAAERNRDILKGLLNFVSLPLTAVLMGVDAITEKAKAWGLISEETYNKYGNLQDKFTTSISELIFDPKAAEEEGQKLVDEQEKTIARLQNQQAGFRNQMSAMDKAAAEKSKAELDKALEERRKREEDIGKDLDQAREQRLQDSLTAEQKELRQNELKYAELLKNAYDNADLQAKIKEEEEANKSLIEKKYADARAEEAKKRAEDTAKFQKAAEQATQDEIAALQDVAYEAGLTQQEKDLRSLQDYYFEKIQLAKQNGIDTTALEKEYADKKQAIADESARKEIEKRQSVANAIAQMTLDGLNIAMSLNETFTGKDEASKKKAFERNKKMQIAQALISSYMAASNTLAAASANPASVLFPGYQFIQAGLSLAAGLAQVAKIAKTTYESPSASGGGLGAPSSSSGGGGGSNQPTPSLSMPQLDQAKQEPMRSYVIATDITRTTEASEKIKKQTELAG